MTKNHATNPRIRKQIRNRAQVLDRAERQAARRRGSDAMFEPEQDDRPSGAQLIAHLEQAGVDPNVVRMVRYGLGAIAQAIRAQAEAPHQLNAIGAAALVDPGIAA